MTVVNITAKTYTDKAEVLRIQEVPLESIIIEDRFRIDMGNIGELSESIEELGFFDPLLIDEDYRLCDGYRRILGLKAQGHTTALCIIIKRPSPLLAIKLEQNSNNIRQEFTWQEKMDIDKALDDFHRARGPNWTQEKQGKLRRC
jgi:ParB-like chromosome segregation protein Spo0J